MPRKIATSIAAIAAAGLLLSGCTSSTPETSGESDGGSTSASSNATFTYAIGGDPMSMNPINLSDRWGLTFANIVYLPLARVEADGTVVNELAEKIEPAEDGLSVTVTLKDDLKWSDGEPITAEDVVFTYTNKAVRENGNADLLYVGDEPITAAATDDHTVVFTLPSLSAAAISNIATETYIIPKHIYGDVTDFSVTQLDPAAIGSGPYKLDEYKPGEYLKFSANENYYGDAPNIPNLILQILTDADTVKTALQTDQVSASFVTSAQVAEFEGTNVTTYPYSEGRVAYLGVQAGKPALADPKVRQALFFALDRGAISDAAFLSTDYYEEAYSILPPSNPWATEDVEKYEQDVAKSKQLLEEANAADLKLTLGYIGTDPAQVAEATQVQEQFAEVGVDLTLSGVDGSALYAELEKGADSKFDLFLGGYIMGLEPDAYSALFRTGASANYFGYSNPEVDALFDAGVAELDDAKRGDIYDELQAKIQDDAVFFPIADNKKIIAMSNSFTGIDEARLVPIYSLENFGKLAVK
ncbi:ABC transporter substrate-binding protein [Microbacterium mitrae]|uniref:ABC transporter substrate-binding protein n=1 Tax=Microbacterium mitrae TaxID=664640 RepID=A0A5C8HTL3_9MICO|nr:ABC transporter substrate-binding protein [Microbacterium mitrae]TXK06423.1 ABC transporter substrate-binding protein [Microbacterium mitrae]